MVYAIRLPPVTGVTRRRLCNLRQVYLKYSIDTPLPQHYHTSVAATHLLVVTVRLPSRVSYTTRIGVWFVLQRLLKVRHVVLLKT